ncbi:NAD(P)/FAD-dependent oxidoreductase [Streptomyces sp. NPDC050147]|uniref:NAD(P)/FAD-dependent oxidoreductase n=1 Tax=Streptomyces sp. NPDC050147 TaxID=3155513 RepID=UPI003441ABF9
MVAGGAAGLNAALTLGRARRTVLLVDAGRQRNAPARSMHNYLGHEGIAPADFLALAQGEAARCGTRTVEASVVAAKRAGDGRFEVALDNGTVVRARRLLLATGLVDELPDVPGVAERWAREVLHCPYCHGWEVRDQAIGVLATGPVGVEQALLWSQWSDDITLFTHTGPKLDDTARARLAARDVRVVEGEVSRLDIGEDRLRGVVLADGRRPEVSHLVVAPRFNARLEGLAGLHVETTELRIFGQVAGRHVVTTLASDVARRVHTRGTRRPLRAGWDTFLRVGGGPVGAALPDVLRLVERSLTSDDARIGGFCCASVVVARVSIPAVPTSEPGWWRSQAVVIQAMRRCRTVRMPPTRRVAVPPSPQTGVESVSAFPKGSGVAAKTESGSNADFSASRRWVFGP